MERTIFNAAQLEMLNAMAAIHTDEELMELKQAISEFFARRAQRAIDKLWDEGSINETKLEEWGHTHMRTHYNQ